MANPNRVTKAVPFFSEAFDSSVTKLPTGFKGHDLDAVWNALIRRQDNFTKSEYETQKQLETRLQTMMNERFFAEMTPANTFAIVLRCKEDKYDAEHQTLSVYLPADRNSFLNEGNTTWEWRETEVEHGKYIGTNAFGVTVPVTRLSRIQLAVVAHIPTWLQRQSIGFLNVPEATPRTVNLQMTPEDARLHRKNLRTLLVGSLVQPFISTSERHFGATIDNPEDRTLEFKNLHMNIQQLWFFDERTGEVVAKLLGTD